MSYKDLNQPEIQYINCPNCNWKVNKELAICPYCSHSIHQDTRKVKEVDQENPFNYKIDRFVLSIMACIIIFIGIVLYFIFHKTQPEDAIHYIKVSLISFLVRWSFFIFVAILV